jgi:hypothetical protein
LTEQHTLFTENGQLSNILISLAAVLLETRTLGANDKWSGQKENGVEKELQDTDHEEVNEDAVNRDVCEQGIFLMTGLE